MCPPCGCAMRGDGDGTACGAHLVTAAIKFWRFVWHGPPDLSWRVRPRPGNREKAASGEWLVACGLRFVADRVPAIHGLHQTKHPPLGEGWGGGFETGKWLVACSSWKIRNAPARITLSIQANYCALRTTYHEPSFPSHTPHPASYLLHNNPPPAGEAETGTWFVARGLWKPVFMPFPTPHLLQLTTHYALRTTYYVRLPPPTLVTMRL